MSTPGHPHPPHATRGIRAPYRVEARIELAATPAPRASRVETIDANEFSIRVRSQHELPCAPVRVHLVVPGGTPHRFEGHATYSRQLSAGLWESGIEFHEPQPSLSAANIDHASYGR